jgi:hypothetical protein
MAKASELPQERADVAELIARVRAEASADTLSRFPGTTADSLQWPNRFGDVLDGHARQVARVLRRAGNLAMAREVARALAAPAGEPAAGALVAYRGSLKAAHGTWQVDGPCPCDQCDEGAEAGFPRRLRLVSPGHHDPLKHVSWLSVYPLPPATPAPAARDEEEDEQISTIGRGEDRA